MYRMKTIKNSSKSSKNVLSVPKESFQIPKIVFQTSKIRIVKYLSDHTKSKCQGWKYLYFDDDDIIAFFKENPIEEFNEAIEIFNSISNGAHKADFFRYYFLYLNGGVYVDSDVELYEDMNRIVSDYSFFTVKSCIQGMFNGFIGAEPKNIIIYQALKDIYNTVKSEEKYEYFIFCNNLEKIINNNKILFEKFPSFYKIHIFNEKLYEEEKEYSIIFDETDNVILRHYCRYKNFVIKPLLPIKNKIPKSIQHIKIGITFDLSKNIIDLFSNGIKQNVLYLYELFSNIGYDTYLIVKDDALKNKNETLHDYLTEEKIKCVSDNVILDCDFNIVFILGHEINNYTINYLRNSDIKVVFYSCGNNYIINSETILYNLAVTRGEDFSYQHNFVYDQIWNIPQMTNTNKYFHETYYRTKCIEVPFVWSNKAVEICKKILVLETTNSLLYKNRGKDKSIAIMEPNISIMKWALPAVLTCENSYRKNKNIKHLYITNCDLKIDETKPVIFNMKAFNNILKPLDLYKDNIISIENRYPTLDFMSKHADIVVSHQWENPLNYLYLDLAWMGWPIVHNAYLCKDIGYYYEDFNYEMGGNILSEAILNHDDNYETYIKENRQKIDRYLPSNKELQKKYKCLISELLS
jgi:hypothetical protein